ENRTREAAMADTGSIPISDQPSATVGGESAVACPSGALARTPLSPAAGKVRARLGSLVRRLLVIAACLSLLALFGFGAWMGAIQVLAWYHYRAARDAVERYHTPDAIKHLKSCLDVWPNDPDS